MSTDRWRALGAAAFVLALSACAPRLRPLAGAPVPTMRLPAAELPPGHRRVVFRWQLSDQDVTVRGEGVARLAAPDSARLDFFLGGGMGSGAAVLIGNELRAPGPDLARRVVPPPALLWATLGRLAVPPARDTAVRVDGDSVVADIGQPVAWRVTFRGDTLVRVVRVSEGRIVEWVERGRDARVRYRHETARRELVLDVVRSEPTEGFDAAIWAP